MSDPDNVKTFLYSLVNQKYKTTPQYTINAKNCGGRQRWICEVRASGVNYVGIGNSTIKKDAQTNAARDFVAYLLRTNVIQENDVPFMKSAPQLEIQKPENQHVFSDVLHHQDDSDVGVSGFNYGSGPPNGGGYNSRNHPYHPPMPISLMDPEKVKQAEECDFTSDIHGGWTLENSKAQLNEYIQNTRQPALNIKYSSSGPAHRLSFIAEVSLLAKRAGKSLTARAEGSNKQTASRAVCLSLVRQLFHAGEIAAYSGAKKKKRYNEVPSRPLKLKPEFLDRVKEVCGMLELPVQIVPPQIDCTKLDPETGIAPGVDIIKHEQLAKFINSESRSIAQTVPWAPPIANWNPWFSCNIDEGPEANMTLDQISFKLSAKQREMLLNPQHKDMLEERSKLPVARYETDILQLVGQNQVTLIRGETGCGKTTQIPQFILDSYLNTGRGGECCVLVTQPRRICAISLAERVASERCEQLGQSVGYCVRFESIFSRPYGSILFCTLGTIIRKAESGLRGISHIIIDEIHERDVNTDFMLIIIKDMCLNNPDLRVVLMSATIDVSLFTDYFPGCKMIDLEGRMHPVTKYFLEDCVSMLNYQMPRELLNERKRNREVTVATEPIDTEEFNSETGQGNNNNGTSTESALANCNLIVNPSYPPQVAKEMSLLVEKEVPFHLIGCLLEYIISLNVEGAVLIFLPGWNIISMLRKHLQSHPTFSNSHRYQILPLHSQVPREEQRAVFRPSPPGVRKIVLSTNIAESSITINDVVFVIDSCLARQKIFTVRNNMTSYTTCWASRTNLEQRRGRAGRVRPGYAFHLCSRARFDRLDQHATPEILRTPLHELALLIKLLRLGSVNEFLMKAIQPPPLDAVIEAEFVLRDMMAFDQNDELTPLGAILARLPMEPRLGRMVIYACIFELGGAGAVLAATASLGLDLFFIPPDRNRLTYEQRKYDANNHSDHLTSMNVFQVWSKEKSVHGEFASEQICMQRQFNHSSLRMVEDAANQIRTILISIGFPEPSLSDCAISFGDMHSIRCDQLRFILTLGLYPNVCFHAEKRKLLTREGLFALCNKASVNCPSLTPIEFTHPYFCYGEKIRTQAVSCKNLTMISPLNMLLGGCRQAVWRTTGTNDGSAPGMPSTGTLSLDDWLPFEMDYETAAYLLALRPALDSLLVRVCADPTIMTALNVQDMALLDLIKVLITDEIYDGPIGDNFQHSQRSQFDGGGGAQPSRKFPANYYQPLLRGRVRRGDDAGTTNELQSDWELHPVRSMPQLNSSGVILQEPGRSNSNAEMADTLVEPPATPVNAPTVFVPPRPPPHMGQAPRPFMSQPQLYPAMPPRGDWRPYRSNGRNFGGRPPFHPYNRQPPMSDSVPHYYPNN